MDLAGQWRNPVMIFTDGILAQMMEPVKLPEEKPIISSDEIKKHKPWALTGYGDDDSNRRVVKSLRMQPDNLEKHVEALFEKYGRIEKDFTRVETINVEDADIVLVAYGTLARITKEAIELLKELGVKAGLIRPISLWPFPYDAFDLITDKTKVVISAELSMGQMIQDVHIGVGKRFPVKLIGRTGGNIPTSLEIAERAKKTLEEFGG